MVININQNIERTNSMNKQANTKTVIIIILILLHAVVVLNTNNFLFALLCLLDS